MATKQLHGTGAVRSVSSRSSGRACTIPEKVEVIHVAFLFFVLVVLVGAWET
jgi:hypothetical protein